MSSQSCSATTPTCTTTAIFGAITDGTASQSEIEKFALQANDVVITKDSEVPSDIGVACCLLDPPETLVCGYHLAIVRPKPKCVDGVVLQAFFSLESVRKHLFAQANGVTRFGLSVKAIESIRLELPSIDEQRLLRSALLAFQEQHDLRRAATASLQREKAALQQRLFGPHQIVEDSDAVAAKC